MKKQIIIDIEKCNSCPFVGHTREGSEGRKPCCGHPKIIKEKGDGSFKRIIPYKTRTTKHQLGITIFNHWVKKIPKWCPLPDKKEYNNDPYYTNKKKKDSSDFKRTGCDATEADIY